MTGRGPAIAALLLLAPAPLAAQSDGTEVVAEVRVHGNYSVPDADVLRLAGVAPGDRLEAGALEVIAGRLRASERFESVDVRKRYTSLSRTDDVALVLVVRERPGYSPAAGRLAQMLAAASRQTMFLPILSYAEGQGLTYGARFALADALGDRGRLSAPLTWGGRRQAALELEKRFDRGPVHALRGGVSSSRVENQHYAVDDRRNGVWFAADRDLGGGIRVSGRTAWDDVRFGEVDDQVGIHRIGMQWDTRHDPGFPRDALFVQAGWQWIDPTGAAPPVSQPQLDARGYLGLSGQSVLAVRAQYQGASAALPLYAQPLLGGSATVRGYRFGVQAGDRLAAASAELRVPVNSPLSFARTGVRVFFDTGAVFDVDQRLRKTRFLQGAGAGVFASVAFLTLELDLARGFDSGLRLHVRTSVSF